MKRYLFNLLASASLLFVPMTSFAADSGGDKLTTLAHYIQYGLSNSAELKSAFDAYRAATYVSPQVSALPDPKLNYGYFIRSVETQVGPQKQKIGIAQSFPWFGTLALREDQANSEASAELNRFLALKNKLVFEISKAYIELVYIDAAISVTKDTIQLVQSWENVFQERFRTSTGSHSDLVRIQLEMGKLEDKLLELKDLRTPLSASLNSLINREVEQLIVVEADFLSSASQRELESISMENLRSGNPELSMLEAMIKAKKSGIRLAEQKFYPDFTLGVDYIATGDRDVADGGKDAVLGMASINIPLNWEKNHAAVNEAKARQKSFKQMKKAREFQLRSELSRAKYQLRDSERKVSLYKNTLIPKTQESIEASYTAYQAGDAGFLDLIDSEQRLLDFQLSVKRAQADRATAATKLQQLAGSFSELTAAEKENSK